MSSQILEVASGKSTQKKKGATVKAKRAFDLALGIEEIFTNGTTEEKKEMLRELQSNLTITDKKINVYNTGTYGKIINGLLSAKAENPSFESRMYGSTKGQNEVFDSVCPTMLRG